MKPKEVVAAAAKILDPKNLDLPAHPKITDIRVREYVDHMGFDALDVWLILDEEVSVEDCDPRDTSAILDAVADALLAADIDYFPYTHFAKESELREAGVEI